MSMARTYWSHLIKYIPGESKSQPLSIKVGGVVLGQMLSEMGTISEPYITGSLHLSWNDMRLKYSKMHFHNNTNSIKVLSEDIWIPDIIPTYSDMIEDVEVFHNGSVEANLRFTKFPQCQLDYTNYPNDEHDCCINFISKQNPHEIDFDATDIAVRSDQTEVDPMWRIVKAFAKKEKRIDDGGNILRLCITVKRYSTTVVYQYSMPMTIVAMIAIVVPFFSGWFLQIGSKLIAISLFLCVESAAVDESIGFGASPPKILVMFGFLLWTTVISLIITVILWSLSRRRWGSVPPTIAVAVANVVNPFFWFTGNEKTELPQLDENGIAVKKDFSPDWHDVFMAVNNICLFLFTLIYVIGIIAYV
uniref:Neurotransmitter-gated ion-channel ligand-binding domain-containing protein n=1 Tax=Plectus sambesii TaxID=2011161 RepID=A0A914WA49_9BILA